MAQETNAIRARGEAALPYVVRNFGTGPSSFDLSPISPQIDAYKNAFNTFNTRATALRDMYGDQNYDKVPEFQDIYGKTTKQYLALEDAARKYLPAGTDTQDFLTGRNGLGLARPNVSRKGSALASILKPIALSAFSAFAGPALGGALLGPGAAGTTAASALGGGIMGAGGGAITGGGLKGALMGGLQGGLGSYINGGLGDLLGDTPLGGLLGDGMSAADDAFMGNIAKSSGVTGGGLSSLGGNVAKSSLSSLLSNGASTFLGMDANDKASDELQKAIAQQTALLQPYTTADFTPGDLTSDPGYQFTRNQGMNAINSSNAARGNYFSGAAVKDLADYTTNLAQNTYQNAYNRWLQGNNARYGAASNLAGVLGNAGTIRANTGINNSNLISRGLSSILGGGFNNTGQSYDDNFMSKLLSMF